MSNIKTGDYIEGYERYGDNIRLTRVIVASIHKDSDGNLEYFGQADDEYYGARGTTIVEELGTIKKIENQKPFTVEWWKNGTGDCKYNAVKSGRGLGMFILKPEEY